MGWMTNLASAPFLDLHHSDPPLHPDCPLDLLLPPRRYVTNLATAPFLDWGRNGGCALPQKKCSVVGAPYFCDQR